MKSKYLLLPLFLLSAVLAWGGGLEAPPSAGEITELKTWIDTNIQATDVGAEIEGAVSAHNASAGTLVHGLGTMSTATATDYAKLNAAASFSARIDFSAAEATNFIATPTINGVDVLGDISTALTTIIGAP